MICTGFLFPFKYRPCQATQRFMPWVCAAANPRAGANSPTNSPTNTPVPPPLPHPFVSSYTSHRKPERQKKKLKVLCVVALYSTYTRALTFGNFFFVCAGVGKSAVELVFVICRGYEYTACVPGQLDWALCDRISPFPSPWHAVGLELRALRLRASIGVWCGDDGG